MAQSPVLPNSTRYRSGGRLSAPAVREWDHVIVTDVDVRSEHVGGSSFGSSTGTGGSTRRDPVGVEGRRIRGGGSSCSAQGTGVVFRGSRSPEEKPSAALSARTTGCLAPNPRFSTVDTRSRGQAEAQTRAQRVKQGARNGSREVSKGIPARLLSLHLATAAWADSCVPPPPPRHNA